MTADDAPTGGGPAPELPADEALSPASTPATTRSPSRRKRLWSYVRRSASNVVVDDRSGHGRGPLEPPPIPAIPRRTLLERTPFSIGFFGALGAALALGLAMVAMQLQQIILLVVVSLFLALGLNPLVERLTRHRVRRSVAVLVVTLAGLGIIVLGGVAVVPVLTQQVNQLITNAPAYLQALRENPAINQIDSEYHIIAKATAFLTSESLINTMFGGILGAGKFVANALISVIVTMVLTIYFLASLEAIKKVIYELSPASRRARTRYLAEEMFRRIGGYLTGMFIVVTIAVSCAFVFMLIAGLSQYALALAFLVGLFAFIPLVGSSISMVIVAVVGFSVSPAIGIAAIVYFLVYQQFDAYVIQPRVMSAQVNVPGPVVVVAALAGGTLLGIVGALLAIPTAAVVLLLYREVMLPHLEAS